MPVRMTQSQKIKKAKKLFEAFRVEEPRFIDEVDLEPLDVGVNIGLCDGILYTTVREGIEESYIHHFDEESKPALVSSYDGDRLFLIGGS